MRKIIALMLALSATPATATCFIAPSWDLGETVITLRASPNGPPLGYLPPDVPVWVSRTAYPWAYIYSPDPCCGTVAGWVWLRSVPAGCLPPPAPCCVTAPQPIEPPYHEKGQYQDAPRYHEKGQYQDAPPPQPQEQLPEAPMPEYGPKGNS